MTKQQKQQVIKILENDCALQAEYVDCNGNTCAIGALLLAAGQRKSTLANYGSLEFEALPTYAKRLLLKRFGITEDVASRIQYQNDNTENKAERRRACIAVVEAAQ